MGRKKDHDYFAMLVEGVNYACEAATMLKTTFENFEPEKLQENINKVHHVEHTADMAKHDMMEKLVKNFVTRFIRFILVQTRRYISQDLTIRGLLVHFPITLIKPLSIKP